MTALEFLNKKLDELEWLGKKATPAPWDNRVNEFSNTAKPTHIWSEYGWLGGFHSPLNSGYADAIFIVEARNNWLPMIGSLRTLINTADEASQIGRFGWAEPRRAIEQVATAFGWKAE